MQEHDIVSADGTKIRVWRSGRTEPDVLLCPGLGTMPEAWPYLTETDVAGLPRVHTWYHRGTLGSARPDDLTHIRLTDHVDDAVAVLDDAGVDQAVVMGWSVGAAVAIELARRCPDRVAGLLLVAGGAGDPFGGVLGALGGIGVPADVRHLLAETAARVLKEAGPLCNAVLHRIPVNRWTAAIVRHSGVMLPASSTAGVIAAGRRFLSHDWGWYATLALALAGEPAPDLADVSCPVTVLTGRYDVIADAKHVAGTVAALPQARLRVLPTSHFLPLEAPDELADELRLLIERAAAVRGATRWTAPHIPPARVSLESGRSLPVPF